MGDRLNILHILRAPVGGLFRHVQDLALEQASQGHRVGLMVDASSGNSLTQERLDALAPQLALGIHRVSMSRNPSLQDFSVIRTTNGLIRMLKLDVVHGHGAKGGLYARLAGVSIKSLWSGNRTAPTRFYTPHGGSLHFTDSFIKGIMYLGIETVLDRFSDGLIFESQFARSAFEEGLGRPVTETRIIANGLQPQDFSSVPLRSDAADFLFIGELRDLKGVDVLLRSFARIEGPVTPRLVIVGEGAQRRTFEQLARDLRIDDRVSFIGAMPAQKAFELGRVLVMPSRAESLPYIALEAAAAGRPLIATRVGGVPEIVWGTDTELVPPDDVDALYAALKGTLHNAEFAKEQAERLRRSVEKRFSVSSMTASVLQFYSDALKMRSLSDRTAAR